MRERLDLRAEDGVTLTELLVVMVFLSVLFSAFAMMMTTSIHRGNQLEEQDTLRAEVRFAIDRLAQDLRGAYTGDSTSPIQSIGGTQITFLSPDRATAATSSPFHLRTITYTLAGGQLTRAVKTSTNTFPNTGWTWPTATPTAVSVLGSLVNTVVFTTVDPNTGACTTTVATDPTARAVCVTVKVAPKHSATQYTYTTNVYLRDGQQ
jgi:Tfp pilus assembly protein PilW